MAIFETGFCLLGLAFVVGSRLVQDDFVYVMFRVLCMHACVHRCLYSFVLSVSNEDEGLDRRDK